MLRRARKKNSARAIREQRLADERRLAAGREFLPKAVNRQSRISIPAMAKHDMRDRFSRCLCSFYGENAVGDAANYCNPLEIPARLGRAEEFWEEWERWQETERKASEAIAVRKQAAVRKLGF